MMRNWLDMTFDMSLGGGFRAPTGGLAGQKSPGLSGGDPGAVSMCSTQTMLQVLSTLPRSSTVVEGAVRRRRT